VETPRTAATRWGTWAGLALACSAYAVVSVFGWYPGWAEKFGIGFRRAVIWELLRWNLWLPVAALILRWNVWTWRPGPANAAMRFGGALLLFPTVHAALLLAAYFPISPRGLIAMVWNRPWVVISEWCVGVIVSSLVLGLARASEQESRASRLEARLVQAQLDALRMQLHPHFLFNTLNAISTLILDNQNKKANHAVTRLSEFLRYTLDQDPMKKVTLRQELEALDLYLGTERLRFAERLRLEYAVEESAMNALVPSLLLQPLLENSLKYAVSAREQGGLVRIEGRTREGWLELSVVDDGPGLKEGTPTAERRGVGLRNTSERLAVLYGDNRRFAVSNAHPGLRVDMALPLELAPASSESTRQNVAARARGVHA